MEKSIWTSGNDALVALIKEKRKNAKLTQADVAKAFGQRQTWVSHLESGERRIDVIEFVKLSAVLGFDASDELRKLIPIISPEKSVTGGHVADRTRGKAR